MAKWEYCELHVVYAGPVTDKIKAVLYTHTSVGVTARQDKYYALMAQLGQDGWELVGSIINMTPGVLLPNQDIHHTFKRPVE